jgi:hypothetical protein
LNKVELLAQKGFGGISELRGYFDIQLTGKLQIGQSGATSPTMKVLRWA